MVDNSTLGTTTLADPGSQELFEPFLLRAAQAAASRTSSPSDSLNSAGRTAMPIDWATPLSTRAERCAPFSPAESRSGTRTTSTPWNRRANFGGRWHVLSPQASRPSPCSAAASLHPSTRCHPSPGCGSRTLPPSCGKNRLAGLP
jgi:hypothetical protein